MDKQVELLAPAGNYQCFQAAINAGADAVYLGGDRFGARAYADNFTKDELLQAIDYGHLFHKKIYLTCNTLLKDKELLELLDYIAPFYEAGLDGVIVQDFGVLSLLKECFPKMELHASTQMAVTGREGAELLKELGVSRIVPARELSLKEIAHIKEHVEIEVETFIHGSMCYAYSGQCLFSSILGERSGNRGRCAGPCRLPYDAFYDGKQINRKEEQYLLSLKDLCSISLLPKLIEAGIDSFKIEGRMKSAEYVAGVTGIYRKYIDNYYNQAAKEKLFIVEEKDLEALRHLYVRSDLETGYYEKHHGASMVTLKKPCYETGNREDVEKIAVSYLKEPLKIPVRGHICLKDGQPVELFLTTGKEYGGETVKIEGAIVQTASNRPIEQEMIKKQIMKTGGTAFAFQKLEVTLTGNCFISVKELNELRRQALNELLEKMLSSFKRTEDAPIKCMDKSLQLKSDENNDNIQISKTTRMEGWHILVSNLEQLETVVEFIRKLPKEKKKNESPMIEKVSIASEIFCDSTDILPFLIQLRQWEITCSIAFPRVVRKDSLEGLKKHVLNKPELTYISSFLTGNLELLGYFRKNYPNKELYGDDSLYCFNKEAYAFLRGQGIKEICIPYEWSRHEMGSFLKEYPSFDGECIVYGYIPLMVSAGCILKTTGEGRYCQMGETKGNCSKRLYLLDRRKKRFPALTHCDRCENTIYNSVPYSLHKELDTLRSMEIIHFRMNFTVETREQVLELLEYFMMIEKRQPPFLEFTKGHFGKGVE